MKKLIFGISLVILVIAAALISSSGWVTREVRAQIEKQCAKCDVELQRASLRPWGIALADFKLAAGEKGGQRVEMSVPAISLHLDFFKIIRGELGLKSIYLSKPAIIFFDGEKKPAKSAAGEPSAELPQMEIEVRDGEFRYVRDVKKTHAELTIHKIDAEVELNSSNAKGHASAQFGSSGEFALDVDTSWGEHLEVKTELDVHMQELVDLSRFFEPNAGVKLQGQLVRGKAKSQLRDRHARAWLHADFKDFKLEVNKMYDRNEVQAFFTNLGAKIAMKKDSKDFPTDDNMASVDTDREKGESIVSFILRGLKEAALKVAI